MKINFFLLLIGFTFYCNLSIGQQYNVSGNAYSGGGQGCYILTNSTGQSGAVWNVNTINLTQPFDISLVLNFGVNDLDNYPSPTCGADGMSFVLQPNGTGVFGIGGGVGFSGINPSLGVIMDTYTNGPDDNPAYDQVKDHMSISKNGSVIHGTANELVPPAMAAGNGFPQNIEDGLDHTFRFVWTPVAGSGTIQVYFDGILRITYSANIVATIFGGNPVVFWGVSGSTGGCWNVQKVCVIISANFSIPTGPYCANQSINFTNTSVSGATINSWKWNFGDGTPIVTTQNATHTYTAAGVYPVTLIITNIAGFSDTITQNITVNSVSVNPLSTPDSICSGQSSTLSATGANSFAWNPGNLSGSSLVVSPTTSTTYTVTGTTSGCTGSSTVTVTVNPNPAIIASATPATICSGDTVLLEATSTVTGTSFNWMPGNLSGGSLSVAPSANTTYTVTGTAAGCTGSSTVSVTFNPAPVVTASAAPDTICSGNATTLTATSTTTGIVYSWMPGNISGSSVNVSPTSTTTYTVTGNASGCIGTATVLVHVNPNLILVPGVTPNAICEGETATLSANANVTGANFIWLPGNLIGNNISVVPSATTTYTVAGDASGCTGSATVQLVVKPNPTISATALPASICNGGVVSLSASSNTTGTTYNWLPGNVSGSPISVSPLTTTLYTVSGNALGCTGSATVSVNIIPVPSLSLMSNPRSGCNPLTVDFQYTTIATLIDSTWTWHFGDGGINEIPSIEQNPTHIFQTPGIFIVHFNGQTLENCPVSGTDTIVVHPQPIADFYFSPEYAFSDNPVINFKDQSIYPAAWSWNFGDFMNPSSNYSMEMSPFHVYADSGNYPVQLIVSNGECHDTLIKWIQIYLGETIFIPNSFSPNGDGKNEIFLPYSYGIDESDYDFVIYDRWGKIMFVTNNTQQGWDGNFNGKKCEPGIYVYTVRYKEIMGVKRQVYGSVMLLH